MANNEELQVDEQAIKKAEELAQAASQWLASPEASNKLSDLLRQCTIAAKSLAEARRIDPDDLNRPVTK